MKTAFNLCFIVDGLLQLYRIQSPAEPPPITFLVFLGKCSFRSIPLNYVYQFPDRP